MAYGLKYILRYETERFGTDFRLLISEKDFVGTPEPKKIGAGRVKITKQRNDKIAGSTLDFSIQSDSNFEYANFFTKDNRAHKVELEFNFGVISTFYIVPDQYTEPYIAPPYDVQIMCTDGLGLLKNEPFELTGMVTRFEAIRYCIDKIGISYPYAININIWESRMDQSKHNMLDQLYFQAEILSGKNCYEAINQLLPENTVINQANGYWMIERPTDRTLDRYLFAADGTPMEGTYNWHTFLRQLGTVEMSSGGKLFPIGNLTFEQQSAWRNFTIKQKFGKRESFLRNYDFKAGSEYWTATGNFFSVKEANGKSFALITGLQTGDLTQYISQSISLIASSPVILKINYSPVGFTSNSVLGGFMPIYTDVYFQVILAAESGFNYYLNQTGWKKSVETLIDIKNVESSISINTLNFKTISIRAAKLPENGTITVKAYQRAGVSPPNSGTYRYTGLAIENVLFYTEDLLAFSDVEETEIILNENVTEANTVIEIMPVDLPDYENVALYFDNGNYLKIGETFVTALKWGSANSTYIEYLAAYISYLYKLPRSILKGEISGWLELNSYIEHQFTNKIYLIDSGTWNLIEHTFELELIELPEFDFSYDDYVPQNIPVAFDPLWNLLNGPITEGASHVFYRNAGNRIVNKFGDSATLSPGHVSFPALDHDIFDRSNTNFWLGLDIVDSNPRKWPVTQLKSATIQSNGTSATQNQLFLNDYVTDVAEILPILVFDTDQVTPDAIASFLEQNQNVVGNNSQIADGSFDTVIAESSTPVVVARKGTIDSYKLAPDSGMLQFSLKGALVEVNVDDDPNKLTIESGSIISHNFNALSRNEINLIKQSGGTYDPTRVWNLILTNIVFANNNEHGIYLKVPTEEGITTSEWIVSESHIDPLRDEGYIIYKLGMALAVVDGKRQINMLFGNTKNKTDWTEITNKPTTFPPSAHAHGIADITGLQTALDNKLETSLKGSVNGLAELDENGFVLNAQLPSYVDDVIERADFASLPIIGESGKIYITTNDNKTYRWSGSTYAVISDTLALGETYATAYRGDRGKIAYDYSQIGHVTLADSRISQWEAAYTARIASLTTSGNSGAATLIGNVLNIPNYTLAGLGGAPASGSGNYIWNGTSQQTGNFNISGIGKASEFIVGTKNISSGVFSIERAINELNKHGFDDYTTLNISSDQVVSGYSSFDAYITLNNSVAANHLNGYQSRINYNGSGNLSISYGYYAALSHGGTGTLDFYRGMGIAAPVKTSSGGINYQQGLYIGDFSTGSLVNEAIHIDGGGIYGGNDLSLNGNAPEFILNSINQGTDSKKWDFFAYDKLKFRLLNDANTSATDIFEVRRIGMSLDGFHLNTTFNAPSSIIYANSGTYIPSKIFGNLNIGNLWYGSILVGRSENTNQSAQFGWVYDQSNPSNSFAHITPYGSGEGSVYKFDAVGNTTLGNSVDTLSYKLSGVDLFGSLTANTLQKWDGAKHTSIANASGYLHNDGTGNMSFGAITGFLPLAGGTLTGGLTGTTANFSGAATAASFVLGSTGWSFEVVSGKLVIKYSGTSLLSLDSSGNLKVVGDGYGGGL